MTESVEDLIEKYREASDYLAYCNSQMSQVENACMQAERALEEARLALLEAIK